MSKLLSKF